MMHAQKNLLTFIGIGTETAAARLYTYVREHPAACVPRDQINFFNDAAIFSKGVAWYERFFVPKSKRAVCGELASNYLRSGHAAQLIARTYPNAKLFAVIEDPLLSIKMEYVQACIHQKRSQPISLEAFIKQTPEVLLRSKFGRLLVPYFSYYSAKDLQVFFAREVEMEPLMVLKKTYEHCGLDTSFVPLALRHLVIEEEDDGKKRPGLVKRSYKRLKQLVKFTYTKITQLLFPPDIPKETLVELAKKVPLSPELEAYLKDYYREDVRILSALLHRDLNAEWSI